MVRTTKNLYMYLLCFCPREHHHRYVGISFVWTPFYPLFMLSWTFSHIILTGGTQQEFFFAGIDGVKFRRPVVPGDQLVMKVVLTKLNKRFGIAKMKGQAFVGEELACEAELTLALGN